MLIHKIEVDTNCTVSALTIT